MHMLLAIVTVVLVLCGTAAAAEVSRVDTSGPRPFIRLDGQPYLKLGAQLTVDRPLIMFNWSWADLGKQFAQAAADGFTDVGVTIRWDRCEVRPNVWDWTDVDRAIDHCQQNGLRMEIIWFTFDFCAKWNLCPVEVVQGAQKVLTSGGAIVADAAGNVKLDRCDPWLLQRETRALGAMMDHIRTYCDSKGYGNVVCGIQLQNEPTAWNIQGAKTTDRSYSAVANQRWTSGRYTSTAAFSVDVLWSYLDALGAAVKSSTYPVYTRVNLQDNWDGHAQAQALLDKNEAQRAGSGTRIDFIGNDPYTSSLTTIGGYGGGSQSPNYATGRNLAVVMENNASYSAGDRLHFAAIAGGAFYIYWDYVDSCPVGDPFNMGLYTRNDSAKTIAPKNHAGKVRSMNLMLCKASRDLAVRKAGSESLRFFNATFAASSTSTQTVLGKAISYATTNSGGGIAIGRDDGSLVFLTTTASTFTVPADVPIASLEHGYFNASDAWVGQGQVAATGGSFTPAAYQCVRLVPGGAATGSIQFGSATYSRTEGASGTTKATITVTRTGGAAGAVGVSYASSNGTATAGSDYAMSSGTLSWSDGDAASKTFTVTVTGDAAYEASETVILTLSAPTGGAALGAVKTAVLTIVNDDAGPPGSLQCAAASASIVEGAATCSLMVTRSIGTTGAVTVKWATSAGTATAGSDYASASGTLSWADGDGAPKTIAVPILADTLVEPSEVLRVVLSNPSGGAVLGTPSTSYITILDNDATPLPAPWTSLDVGGVLAIGSASLGAGDLITLAGSGSDIWNQADGCQFASQPINGDFDLVARVDSQSNTHTYAKAGLMVREGTAAGSRHASCLVTPANGSTFCMRTVTGGGSTSIAGPQVAAPTWLKLSRRGASFSGYQSADGASWTLVGTQTISLPSSLLAGLAVSSHANGKLSVAQFSQVVLAPVASN